MVRFVETRRTHPLAKVMTYSFLSVAPLFLNVACAQVPTSTRYEFIPDEALLSRLSVLSRLSQSVSAEVFEVKGERRVESAFLPAQSLILHPGSRLVLSSTVGPNGWLSPDSAGAGQELYLIATSIRVLPGLPPPIITWDSDSTELRLPPSSGRAQSGTNGRVEGASGTGGAAGSEGNPGFPGKNAPRLFLAAREVSGGPIYVDLSGQPGGPGGDGQAGGEGGNGQRGTSAKADIFTCRSGGGRGGDGGAAGPGGKGGPGGRGGDAGSLVLISSGETRRDLERAVVLVANGGPGGKGGRGGPPGQPGIGGPPGPANLPFCGGGTPGANGAPAKPGPDNDLPGPNGTNGTAYSVEISPRNMKAIGF